MYTKASARLNLLLNQLSEEKQTTLHLLRENFLKNKPYSLHFLQKFTKINLSI